MRNILLGCLLFLLSGFSFSGQIHLKRLKGETISVDISDSDTVLDIKLKIQKEKDIFPEDQAFIYNGISLEDAKTLSFYGIQDGCHVNLVIANMHYLNRKYGSQYAGLLRDARSNLKESIQLIRQILYKQAWVNSGRQLAHFADDFIVDRQILTSHITGLFSYKLPVGFFDEAITELRNIPFLSSALSNDAFINKEELLSIAAHYLQDYATGLKEEQISSMRNDPAQFQDYVISLIKYQISLARMLKDEGIRNVEERFFKEFRTEFTQLYDSVVLPPYIKMLEKYQTAHGQNN